MTVEEALEVAATTYVERNGKYQDAWRMVGPLFKALFPEGVTLESEDDFTKFHLLVMIGVKLTRFANSTMTHEDSIRDTVVHAAMLATMLEKEEA